VSTPLPEGAVHLLVADDALGEQHAYRAYLAVCGALMPASSLPLATCPRECDRDYPYCPECLREATRWHAEAGRAR
jgi:hypothetical protein